MTENSGQPTRRANPLAQAARVLVAASRRGVLATLLPEGGYPYGSLVDLLPLPDGDVVMFLSRLAEHQRSLTEDPRASILIAPHIAEDDALAQARVTLVGQVVLDRDRGTLGESYVALHPSARSYLAFPDFQFYRLRVERARYIAGFGQMGWIGEIAYRAAVPASV